jgi:hypothetical protein
MRKKTLSRLITVFMVLSMLLSLPLNAAAILDTDGDGIPNESDNAPNHANPDQKDSDADGVGDVADATPYGTEYDIEAGAVVIASSGYYYIYGAGNATTNTITVNTGVIAGVRLSNVNVNVSATLNAVAFDIQGTAEVTLTLADGSASTFRSGGNKAGVQVADGAGLTVRSETLGTGILNAFGGGDGAGIGGGSLSNPNGGGAIVINSGTINATGGCDGAGIGSGDGGNGCNVTINGGTVTATGTDDGAGIGAGGGGDAGTITIHGGTVIAASSGSEASYYGGSGIGSGADGVNGTILIDGGTVTATGRYDCPGIGGDYNPAGKAITISGASTIVNATGGTYAAAIGGGYGGGGGTINILGGTVTATGRYRGAGIGDYAGSGTVINIGGGDITATGGQYANALGRGYSGSYLDASLNFNGGNLTVSRGADATYDINATIQTTESNDFSAGGCFKPQSGQIIALSGPVLGVFSYDKSGTTPAAGDTVISTATASSSGYFALSTRETDMQIVRQSGNLSWKYAADTAGPALSAAGLIRSSSAAADVTFTSDEWAEYYYAVVGDGADAPTIDTSGSGIYCAGQTTLSLSALTAGAKDLYIVAKDEAGNAGSPIMFDIAATHVCKIGYTGYETVQTALSAVGAGETKTIELLSNITTNTDICFGGKNVNFDLNAYTLNVATLGGETGLHTNAVNISVDDTGGGDFNINGCNIGVDVANGSVTVTNVTTKDGYGVGVKAGAGGTVIVKGDINVANGTGAAANDGGIVVVEGEVSASTYVDINGTVLAKTDGVAGEGAYADYMKYAVAGSTSVVYVKTLVLSESWTDSITSAVSSFGGGNGSSAALAYEISTPAQLAQLAYNVNHGYDYSGKYFKQVSNLDLAGKYWTPIGYRFYPGNEKGFNGTFDGNGYAISNLSIGTAAEPMAGGDQTQAGLFGALKNAAVLKDIRVSVSIYTNGVTSVGALVGYDESEAPLSGCSASGTIVSAGSGDLRIGGLIGDSTGASILRCSSDVDVTAAGGTAIGGVIGYPGSYSASEPREVNGCLFTGTINAGSVPSYGGVGGIAGKSYGYFLIVNCVNKGSVSGANGNIGGIVGIQHNDVANCYSSGTVSSSGSFPSWVGGITGYIDSGAVYNCYDSGRVSATGSALVGAIVGYGSAGTTVSNAYFDDTVNPDLAHVRSIIGSGHKYFLSSYSTAVMKGATPETNVEYASGISASGAGAVEAALNGWIAVQTAFTGVTFAHWKTDAASNDSYPYLAGVEYTAADATLASLSATDVTLTPAFGSGVTSYSASVANSVGSTTVAAQATVSAASVKINGTVGTTRNIALNTGSNLITVQVTAEDGTTTQSYTISISRAAASGGGDATSPGQQVTVTTRDGDTSVQGTLTSRSDKDQVDVSGDQFGQLAGTDKDIVIPAPSATVTFDAIAVNMINSASSSGDVVLSIQKVDTSTLTSEQQQRVGDRPVYDFSVTKGGVQVSDFGGGHAQIAIPYVLKPGENPNQVVIYYLADDGTLKTVRGHYDPIAKSVIFITTHFSKYLVCYNALSFTDVPDKAWYKDAVDFIAAHGITSGTGIGAFSPDALLTRGQFVVLLMNAYGISPDSAPAGTVNFADAGSTYYTAYLQAAKGLGLGNGVGNNMFAPEQAITRQEMFVMLYNALKVIGELPAASGTKQLSDFGDANQVASWAQEAMNALVKGGVISGSNGMLNPVASTTRAEMAQILYNLLSR